MQITCLALEQYLSNHTPRCCLIWGSETYLIEESRKAISQHYFSYHSTSGKMFISFEQPEKALHQLEQEIHTSSLFCERKLIFCLVNTTLNAQHRKTLTELLPKLPASYGLVMQFEKIPTPQQKEGWYQYFLKQGVTVTHWPLTPAQYKQYLNQHALKLKRTLTASALQFITVMTEGHALAGIQTLEKLNLSLPENHSSPVREDELMAIMSQQSRYTLNDLYLAILEDNPKRTQEILENFKETKTPLPLITWGLHQLLQAVFSPMFRQSGLFAAPVLPKTSTFQHLVEKKQKQSTPLLAQYLIDRLHQLDTQLKSYQSEQPCWQACLMFCLQFSANSTQFEFL